MKIVVIGGTGLIGSKVVSKLVAHGHDAVPASPGTGVNTLTGEGLAEDLAGADVVVDVSNSPSFEDTAVLEFFETSTRNILDAEAIAGVGHHVVLSVVGTERLAGSGYMRAKTAQEKLIKNSSISYTIVHAAAGRLAGCDGARRGRGDLSLAQASGEQPGHPVEAGWPPGCDLGVLAQLVVTDIEGVGQPGPVGGL
jgi:uncharacterized protein YbjT (DUF2867 family)